MEKVSLRAVKRFEIIGQWRSSGGEPTANETSVVSKDGASNGIALCGPDILSVAAVRCDLHLR
jgi:hypothetical protein